MIKRLRPAPQGRGHRIRKRSNHVTLKIDTKVEKLGSKAARAQAAASSSTETKADADTNA